MNKYKKKPLLQHEDTRRKELKARIEGHMSFSFEFYREIENFGVGDCDNQWFCSLLNAINNYSGKEIKGLPNNKSTRFHQIEWGQPNIPISFDDLNWLPKNDQILVNPKEIYQLNITQGSGRIIGFSIANVFYVVLLDPKHNMQPSVDFDYKVNPTTKGETQYEELKEKYDLLYEWTQDKLSQEQQEKLKVSKPNMHVIFTYLSETDYNDYKLYCTNTTVKNLIVEYSYKQLENIEMR